MFPERALLSHTHLVCHQSPQTSGMDFCYLSGSCIQINTVGCVLAWKVTKDFTAVLLMWCVLLAPFSSCYWQFAHYMPIPSKVLLLFWRMLYTHQKTLKLDQKSLLSSWPSFFLSKFPHAPKICDKTAGFLCHQSKFELIEKACCKGKKVLDTCCHSLLMFPD